MNQPRAALFDLDDTLLGRSDAFEETFKTFYRQQSVISASTTLADAMEFFHLLSPHGTIDAQLAALRLTERWPELALDPVEFEEWFFTNLASTARPLDGAVDFINALNDAQFPWGLVTNGKKFQVTKLQCSGLVDIVPFAIVSGLFGTHKPDPSIYLEATRRLKLSYEGIDDIQPSEILFVGDNPYTDITGAAKVGIKTAWIRVTDSYPDDAPQPDMQIDSVVELRELLLG